ncbi:MAG: hypothetical protein ABIQ40_18505 [Bacteroidia bacterium]
MKFKLKNKISEEITITPLVKSLSGIVKLPANFNFKKEIAKSIANKYQ